MRFKKFMGTFAILAVTVLAGPAFAHPKLESASPAADVSVIASPKEIKLSFSEGIISKFSGLELKDEGGRAVSTGDAATDPKDAKQLVVPVSATLAPGRYTVSWHAVSEDTHKVNGDYSFRVIAENASPPVNSEGSRGGNEEPAAKQRNTDEVGTKECFCKDNERTNRARERSRDAERESDPRDRYRDRNSGNREGYRDRNSANRYESRERPDCVVDDEGSRYCKVR